MAGAAPAAAAAAVVFEDGKRSPMQNWEMFPFFLPQGEWDSFKQATNMVTALDGLLAFLVNKIGLRTPSEPTQAIMASLLILQEGDQRRNRSSDALRSLFCVLELENWRLFLFFLAPWFLFSKL